MLFWLTLSALAADWLTLAGTELGRDDVPVEVFGFVQPQFDAIVGGELIGGERPVFNTVNGGGPSAFQVRRARLAARGSLPKTQQRVSYFLMTEAGEVSVTRGSPVVFTDMTVTLSAPYARLRVGQQKLPVMEEVVQGVAGSLEFIHFSSTLTGLLLENPIRDDGSVAGGAYGFRDVGAMVFEGFQEGHLAGSYAVMVSNGNGMHAADADAAKDVSGRAELAWVTDGERTSPRREEIKVGAWWLEGTRAVGGERVRRMRRGAFVHVEQGTVWGMVEVAQGVGALEVGKAPPFPDGLSVVAPLGEAWGGVAQGGVRLSTGWGTLGLKARYDRYHRQVEDAASLRVFQTGTLGVELNPVKKLRLQANYELRRLEAPSGSQGARQAAAAMGDRFTSQITVLF